MVDFAGQKEPTWHVVSLQEQEISHFSHALQTPESGVEFLRDVEGDTQGEAPEERRMLSKSTILL